MIRNEIINVMAKCSCGTRIAWTRSNDTVEHRGVVDEFYPQNGAEDAYLAVIEPGRYIPVLGASEIQKYQFWRTNIGMSNYVQKSPEMDRIADAFSGYVHRHPNLDLVWSEKIGYVLMTVNPDKQLGEEYCSFHTAHSLAYRLLSEIVTDVVLETESWNDSSNLDEMETKEVRLRWTPFLEILPEYASVCEDILTGNKDKYSE